MNRQPKPFKTELEAEMEIEDLDFPGHEFKTVEYEGDYEGEFYIVTQEAKPMILCNDGVLRDFKVKPVTR